MHVLLAVDPTHDPVADSTGWAVLLLVAGAVLIALWVLRRLVEREQDRAE